MSDAHFAWLLGEREVPDDAPSAVAEGGVADRETLEMLRALASTLGGEAAWLMVADDEAVGMISVKARDAAGCWDIGYGIAASRRQRGHATAAVAALKECARELGAHGRTAETLIGGGESARLLRRNGFVCTGQFDHPDDGMVDQWKVEW